MRWTDVRDAIADALEAIEPDHQATAEDRFTRISTGLEPDPGTWPDRTFMLSLSPNGAPRRVPLMTTDRYTVTIDCFVAYAATPESDDRIGLDCERIQWALDGLTADHADIATAEVITSDPDPYGASSGFAGLYLTIEIQYRLTGLQES